MALEDDTPALMNLTNLETRLRNLEFLLSGSTNDFGQPISAPKPSSRVDTITARLEKLEKQLRRLSEQSTLVQEVLMLQKRWPDLFVSASQRGTQTPASLDPETTCAIVLAHASAYTETAGRMASLKDLDALMPPAAKSAILIDLQPRIDKVMEEQKRQRVIVSELRARSARLVERWVGLQVGMGDVWSEWERRVGLVERGVGRLEAVKKREEKE